MKRIIPIIFAILLLASSSQAFLYSLEILNPEQIKALADDKLNEIYTEAMIEDKTSGEFVKAAGFNSAKEYEARKKLLRFIVDLRREMAKRGVEPEPIEDWLQ